MPRFGLSRSDYFFDKDKNVIAKGLTSIKFMSAGIAEELYSMAHENTYTRFVDVLYDIDTKTSINTRQLDILIKLDFFSSFGNQRELLRITDMFFDVFKKGQAKKISKEKVDGTALEPIISKYAVGVTKSGQFAKSYTLLDVSSILREVEDAILAVHMPDIDTMVKVQNFVDATGYVGYISGKEEDRRNLYIMDMFPLKRKRDGKQFGYSVITKSIGSGKESRFTIFNKVYDACPIQKGDIVFCQSYMQDGKYYTMTGYRKEC